MISIITIQVAIASYLAWIIEALYSIAIADFAKHFAMSTLHSLALLGGFSVAGVSIVYSVSSVPGFSSVSCVSGDPIVGTLGH